MLPLSGFEHVKWESFYPGCICSDDHGTGQESDSEDRKPCYKHMSAGDIHRLKRSAEDAGNPTAVKFRARANQMAVYVPDAVVIRDIAENH